MRWRVGETEEYRVLEAYFRGRGYDDRAVMVWRAFVLPSWLEYWRGAAPW